MFKKIIKISAALTTLVLCMANVNVYAKNTSAELSDSQKIEKRLKSVTESAEIGGLSETSITNAANLFDDMSNEELNNFILQMKIESNISVAAPDVPTGNLQLAWLAAAQIAKNNGYPCAAAMVVASVNNQAYVEEDINHNLCRPKIKETSVYKNYVSRLKRGLSVSKSMTFTKSADADLFYSLHNVSISYTPFGSANLKGYSISIHDVFDFDLDNNYNDLFTSLVNNWAWLCQQTGVLHPITIDIKILE